MNRFPFERGTAIDGWRSSISYFFFFFIFAAEIKIPISLRTVDNNAASKRFRRLKYVLISSGMKLPKGMSIIGYGHQIDSLSMSISVENHARFEEYTCVKAVLLAFDFRLVLSLEAFELHRESTSNGKYIHTHDKSSRDGTWRSLRMNEIAKRSYPDITLIPYF